MVKVILTCVILISAASTLADELVRDATIVRVASSYDGISDNFFLEISGGTGPCANGSLVFPRNLALNDGVFSRLFAIALTAYTTGNTKVRAYTPNGSDCLAATFIEVGD